MPTIKIEILSDIPGYKKGERLTINVDKQGTPMTRFWRRRFKDAKTDNCLAIVRAAKPQKSEYKQEKSK